MIAAFLVVFIFRGRHHETGRPAAGTESETQAKPEEAGSEESSSSGASASNAGSSDTEEGQFTAADLLEQGKYLTELNRPWSETGRQKPKKKENKENPSLVTLRPVHKDTVYLATDIHYYPSSMTDGGEAFQDMLDADDGKDIPDIEEILDSWIDEVIEERPATVVLSGDLTLNGESIAHKELAEKLKRFSAEGIQVLVIPGNHDINNEKAAFYFGTKTQTATSPDAEEFREIYRDFGYGEAAESDPDSLSYVYKIDDGHWLLMLDSAVYDPVNRVYGEIRPETLNWMETVLKEAKESGALVIPVAHHNLLSESRLYTTECTLNNHSDVIKLLEEYGVPLYLSGHLHLQRIKEYLPEPGADKAIPHVAEAVTGCFAMDPFPYGIIKWTDGGTLSYEAKEVKTTDAVRENGLMRFKSVITKQAVRTIGTIPDNMKETMADFYADLLQDYVSGTQTDRKELQSEKGYQLFQKFMAGSREMKKVEDMLTDSEKDGNRQWKKDF